MTLKILVVDDHKMMREGLVGLLEREPDLKVVGEAADGRLAIEMAERLRPDFVIMDITMPQLNGIEATRRITAACPDIRVIALSIHSDRRFIREMFQAGAQGYLPKECAFDELAGAIRRIQEGEWYVSPSIPRGQEEIPVSPSTPRSKPAAPPLSPREREILQALAEGKNVKGIALQLGISVKTVETHRASLMAKLQLNSMAELTRYAIREGLSPL